MNFGNCSLFNIENETYKEYKNLYSLIDNRSQYVCKDSKFLNWTYISNGKENCTSCKDYYNLENNICVFNNTCNDDENC